MGWFAEAQRVHGGDGARAHGEDVAQDAADAGGRALIGLDEGGMVVAFHLEDDGIAVADVDDAGILARALDDLRPLGGHGLEPLLGRLVGTVLVPHGRADAEFGDGGLAAQQFHEALVFIRLEAVGFDEVRGDLDVGGEAHGGRL